jgi:hypothetical protein
MIWSFQDACAFNGSAFHVGKDKRWTYKPFKWMMMDKDDYKPNWIEWNLWNNTIYDIISGDWLKDKKSLVSLGDGVGHQHKQHVDSDLITGCKHPTVKGHQLVADTLQPYIEEEINSMLYDPYVYE